MQSELDILKAHGLSSAPESSEPAPSDATATRQSYEAAVKEFNQLISKILSYGGHAASVDVSVGVLKVIDQAAHLAAQVRERARGLGNYPNTFFRIGSEAVYFRSLADVADEAYNSRIAELEKLESRFGAPRGQPITSFKILELHEGFKGGHVKSKHVDQTMEDFKTRFLAEEERGHSKTRLSSLIGATADEVAWRALELAKDRIDQLQEGQKLLVSIRELQDVGYVKERSKPFRLTKSGRLVIFKDSSHPSGYRIKSVEMGEEGET